jgi:toxin ParE1/3/4
LIALPLKNAQVRIEWRPLAQEDVAEIVSYIAAGSPRAAYEIHDRIREAATLLATHTHFGRAGRVKGTRELVISGTPFIVAYRVTKSAVSILRVLHGARKWPGKF